MDIYTYLERIGYQGPLEPTLPVLRALHKAHMQAVPFENLSIHYGQPIILDEEALYQKVVQRHRGGFCYELNGIFAWLLRELGFQVTMLSAGVSSLAGGFGPEFDHMALLVSSLEGAEWLVDVGFGDSFRLPLRFEEGLAQEGADGRRYRVQREPGASEGDAVRDYWRLQRSGDIDAEWEAEYRFTLQPRLLADYTQMCNYHQTSPQSHFTQKRLCTLAIPEGRITLVEQRLVTTAQGKREERTLQSDEEYRDILKESFGIVI